MKKAKQLFCAGAVFLFAAGNSHVVAGYDKTNNVAVPVAASSSVQTPDIVPPSPVVQHLPKGVSIFDFRHVETPKGEVNLFAEVPIARLNEEIRKRLKSDTGSPVAKAMETYKGPIVESYNVYELKGDTPDTHHIAMAFDISLSKEFIHEVYPSKALADGYYVAALGRAAKDHKGQWSVASLQREVDVFLSAYKEKEVRRIGANKAISGERKTLQKRLVTSLHENIQEVTMPTVQTGGFVGPVLWGTARVEGLMDGKYSPVGILYGVYETNKGVSLFAVLTPDSSFDYWNGTVSTMFAFERGGIK